MGGTDGDGGGGEGGERERARENTWGILLFHHLTGHRSPVPPDLTENLKSQCPSIGSKLDDERIFAPQVGKEMKDREDMDMKKVCWPIA